MVLNEEHKTNTIKCKFPFNKNIYLPSIPQFKRKIKHMLRNFSKTKNKKLMNAA